MMRKMNIHWLILAQLWRRGDLRPQGRITPDDVNGYITALSGARKNIDGIGDLRNAPW